MMSNGHEATAFNETTSSIKTAEEKGKMLKTHSVRFEK